ncbi:MAG: hypothetical protein LW832_11145 [Parachlamydia sp.]|nr:hypothetical protein [Parachlamydia sp.]
MYLPVIKFWKPSTIALKVSWGTQNRKVVIPLLLLIKTAVDHLVDALYKEWETTEATLMNDHLYEERQNQRLAASQKSANRRATLTSYISR